MKKIYAEEAARTNVYWNRRSYDPQDFESSDPINQALTSGSAALYGVAHAVISALGFVPSLGIVHTGTDRSFVYDIADLYKAEVSIPAAFDALSAEMGSPSTNVRRNIRDRVVKERIMQRMVRDLKYLFDVDDEYLISDVELMLWSELEVISSGVNWSEDEITP
ncbi:CRISPR-associated protein [Corynebacterium casei LMG S-19264]|nr:CRISPR-associated protein [Corynebacterium casei LMG S-19264]